MISKHYLISLSLVVLLVVLCNAGEKGKYVIELDTKSFQEMINDPINYYLVEFYDPICGACKNFAPEYAKIGSYLRGIIKVGRLSTQPQDHKTLIAQYKVPGVPHVALFLPGDPIPKPFPGPARTPAAISRWVISQLDPLLHLEGGSPRSITGYFGEGEGGAEQEEVYPSRFLLLHEGEGEALDAFRALAGNKRGEAVFAEVVVGRLAEIAGGLPAGLPAGIPAGINVTTYPALVVHKGLHGEGPRYVVYERDWQDSLKEFWQDMDAQVLATLRIRQPILSLPMFTLLFFMVIVCAGLFFYFKKKNLVRNVGELTNVTWGNSKVD